MDWDHLRACLPIMSLPRCDGTNGISPVLSFFLSTPLVQVSYLVFVRDNAAEDPERPTVRRVSASRHVISQDEPGHHEATPQKASCDMGIVRRIRCLRANFASPFADAGRVGQGIATFRNWPSGVDRARASPM